MCCNGMGMATELGDVSKLFQLHGVCVVHVYMHVQGELCSMWHVVRLFAIVVDCAQDHSVLV